MTDKISRLFSYYHEFKYDSALEIGKSFVKSVFRSRIRIGGDVKRRCEIYLLILSL